MEKTPKEECGQGKFVFAGPRSLLANSGEGGEATLDFTV